jgi:hypothetical protein
MACRDRVLGRPFVALAGQQMGKEVHPSEFVTREPIDESCHVCRLSRPTYDLYKTSKGEAKLTSPT